MLRGLIALLFAAGVVGGGKPPDKWDRVGGIVRLQGRFGSGHACPIAPTLALTNAHMVDFREPTEVIMDGNVLPPNPPPYRFESLDTASSGSTWVKAVAMREDLAILEGEFKRFYPLAAECPLPDEKVINLAYSLDDKKGTLRPKVIESKVLVSVAGKIEYDESGSFGSSGSCVLNERDEVVAINSQVLIFPDKSMHGQGVLVCGKWQPVEFQQK